MNARVGKFVKYWVPAIVWIVVALIASSDLMSAERTSRFFVPFLRWLTPDISPETVAMAQLMVRKLAHLTEYGVMAALLLRAIRAGTGPLGWPHVLIALAVAAVCAVSDEFHQSFVASRTGSALDVMIDITGALIGIGAYWLFLWWRREAAHPSRALAGGSAG
ncbi:MAG: VanZ family protein [Chthoniobacterales bacterium]|nr:VanZ family protein [Chthoniobacterales bacterium]